METETIIDISDIDRFELFKELWNNQKFAACLALHKIKSFPFSDEGALMVIERKKKN